MVNHLRTILLNLPGNAVVPDWVIGEELVPSDYPGVDVSRFATIRAQLFGTNPDRSYLNYRLATYLSMLHVTFLWQYIYLLDPRVTYLPGPIDLFPPDAFTPAVNTNSGLPLIIQGDPLPIDASGRSHFEYSIEVLGGDTVQVIRSSTNEEAILSYTITNDLSSPNVLGSSGYNFRFPAAGEGTTWQISFHNRPQRDPGQVLAAIKSLAEPTLIDLFRGPAPVEPFKTFQNLFYDHTELPYQLGGVLLSLAYQTDLIRGGLR